MVGKNGWLLDEQNDAEQQPGKDEIRQHRADQVKKYRPANRMFLGVTARVPRYRSRPITWTTHSPIDLGSSFTFRVRLRKDTKAAGQRLYALKDLR